MALGAHSETYNGVSMDAAPTPKPANSLPTYMIASEPLELACSATPTQVMIPAPTRGHLRPKRSAMGQDYVGQRVCQAFASRRLQGRLEGNVR